MSDSKPTLPEVEPTYDPSRPFPTVLPLYNHPIPISPGKSIIAFNITFPPNGSIPPHSHRGAFITAHITSGHIINAMNNSPMKLLGPGDVFVEFPGCRHRICENASETVEAGIMAIFIVDTSVVEEFGTMGMVEVGLEWREVVEEATRKMELGGGEEVGA